MSCGSRNAALNGSRAFRGVQSVLPIQFHNCLSCAPGWLKSNRWSRGELAYSQQHTLAHWCISETQSMFCFGSDNESVTGTDMHNVSGTRKSPTAIPPFMLKKVSAQLPAFSRSHRLCATAAPAGTGSQPASPCHSLLWKKARFRPNRLTYVHSSCHSGQPLLGP